MRIANKILQNKGFYYIIILLGMFLITQTCFAQALENPLGKDATFAELIGKVADIPASLCRQLLQPASLCWQSCRHSDAGWRSGGSGYDYLVRFSFCYGAGKR